MKKLQQIGWVVLLVFVISVIAFLGASHKDLREKNRELQAERVQLIERVAAQASPAVVETNAVSLSSMPAHIVVSTAVRTRPANPAAPQIRRQRTAVATPATAVTNTMVNAVSAALAVAKT